MDYNKKFQGKYFGPDKIKEANAVMDETYLGKRKVRIAFENEKELILPLEVAEEIVTKEKTDLSDLRERRVKPIVEKILVILVESELTLPDMNYAIGPKLKASIQDSIKKADEELWGKENDKLNLMDVEEILRKKRWKEKKK